MRVVSVFNGSKIVPGVFLQAYSSPKDSVWAPENLIQDGRGAKELCNLMYLSIRNTRSLLFSTLRKRFISLWFPLLDGNILDKKSLFKVWI